MGDAESSELIRAEAVQGAPNGPAWSFAVPRGGALWIPDGGDSDMAWLDWLTGIEPPPAGRMFWKGVEWRERGADDSSAERGRMGCTFAAGGLLANLDMDENVWMPSRMHRREGAEAAIERWARHFGVWPLPAARAPPEDRALFLEAVRQVRAGGGAVVWLDESLDAETRAALEPLARAAPETA